MDPVVKRKIAAVFSGALLAAVLAASPARAADDTLFGQPAPKQFLLNKLLNPQSGQSAGSSGQAAGSANGQAAGANNGQPAGGNGQAAGGNGQVAAGEATEADEDGPGPYPKRYLLNKLFDLNK